MALLFLTVAGMFLNGRPIPVGYNQTLNECFINCYFNMTCEGLFYNTHGSMCYQDSFLYSFPTYPLDVLQANPDYNYFEWELDVCKDSGWTYHRRSNTCFKFMDENASQKESAINCQAMNSSLLKLNTEAKSNFFLQFGIDTGRHIWTSGQKTDQGWVWGNGVLVGSNTDWRPGHPKSANECLIIPETEGGWKSFNCTNRRRYICERIVDEQSRNCFN